MSEQSEPTANDQEQRRTPPPPRRKASQKRTPPPPRRGSNGNSASSTKSAEPTLADVLTAIGELGRRVEQVESGSVRYIESQPEPKADQRVADPESLSDFQRTLLEQTHEVPTDFDSRPKRWYNFPDATYLKPDGSFVRLQGSPQAKDHYVSKGYKLLNEAETKHYETVERSRILREQRQKAHLINTIRKMFQREPALAGFRNDPDYDVSLDLMSISQLEDEWEDLRARSVNPNQKLPPLPRFRSEVDAEAKRMLAGVETNANMSMEELEAKVGRAKRSGRAIEVTSANWNQFT